jgi:hypothetical protein
MPICGECQEEFTPKKHCAHREICYKQECIDARESRRNRAKADRASQLRRGIGISNVVKRHSDIWRNCLKCGSRFEVPPDTDAHLCLKCSAKNARLAAECNEEALGISCDYHTSGREMGNGGRRAATRKSAD